jgi:hypothetical protein
VTTEEIYKLAKSEWDAVYIIEKLDVLRGGVPAPGSELERKAPGRKVKEQWKVYLHSYTGPVHFIAILDDGSAMLK